jgi:hypothetical protein
MSPHLLYLLTARRTHHALQRDRDRIDARLAAARLPMDPLRQRVELRSIAAATDVLAMLPSCVSASGGQRAA